MNKPEEIKPDNTAVRTALWRALHTQEDAKPHIIEDIIGLKLIDPPDDWKERPDMKFTKRLRASVIARARLCEDIIIEQIKEGIDQCVILGSGLDTMAQRKPDILSRVHMYEIDQPNTFKWKKQRLLELGYNIPQNLQYVAVDFEKTSWWEGLLKAGFDKNKPAVIVCTGVSLYLTQEAIKNMLKQITQLSTKSTLVMSFYLPINELDEEDKPMQEMAEKGAREAGTPMISFFTSEETLALVSEVGFKNQKIITTKDIELLYFKNREDELLPASGEIFLVATV